MFFQGQKGSCKYFSVILSIANRLSFQIATKKISRLTDQPTPEGDLPYIPRHYLRAFPTAWTNMDVNAKHFIELHIGFHTDIPGSETPVILDAENDSEPFLFHSI